MSNIFTSGIKINDGLSVTPALSFLTDSKTGLFLNSTNQNVKSLGIAANGHSVVLFGSDQIQLLQQLNISDNAVSGATLTSDVDGNASWQTSSQSGTFKWNSIYSNLDVTTPNNVMDITFDQPLTAPTITISKESDYVVDNFDIYLKGKTQTGFKIYSSEFMYKSLISESIGEYTTTRLSTGGIGICYYNIDLDRMQYIYSPDSKHNVFSAPITIDDTSAVGQVSMCMVDNYPAITYIADNDNNDEWRYVIANDINGATWKAPVVLMTSTADVTFSPVSLFLRVVNGNPAVFLSNQTGRAQMYRSKDTTGLAWSSVVNISNLVNHQILDVQIINGNPSIIAKSNIVNNLYYVQSPDFGTTWPIGATQIYKSAGAPLYTNDGKCCNTMGIINGKLSIIASELHTNDMYIAVANDVNGATWGPYNYLVPTNTTNAYPHIFLNNSISYVIYNNTTGSTSEKKLIEFTPSTFTFNITDNFISTLKLCGDHQVIANKNDNNNIIIMASDKKLSLLKFYGNDLCINWIAMI